MKSQNKVRILVVGDIVGKGARNAFINYLPQLKEKFKYDIIVVNAENTTHGRGLNYKHYCLYQQHHIDVMTMGNHVLDNLEIIKYIDKTTNLIVPGNINYAENVLNLHKECILTYKNYQIKFINLLEETTMNNEIEMQNPLHYFDNIYQEDLSKNKNYIYIVDYHSEHTLQKNLMGYYVDGRASLIYGTHTHVQTADERILPHKTAYISDVGMCGSFHSIIGYDVNSYIKKVKENTPTRVSLNEPFMINGLFVEIDLESKEALSILRINEKIM